MDAWYSKWVLRPFLTRVFPLLFLWGIAAPAQDAGKIAEARLRQATEHFVKNASRMESREVLKGLLQFRDMLTSEDRLRLINGLRKDVKGGAEDTLNYEAGAALFSADRYGEAIRQFRKVSSECPDMHVKSLYSSARAFRNLLNIPAAVDLYRQLILHYPQSDLADDAQFWIAHLEEDYNGSIESFRLFPDQNIQGDHRQGALARLAGLLITTGRTDEALRLIHQYRNEFESGFEAEFSEYYIRNHDYDAALKLLRRDDNTWPGRFQEARFLLESMLYDGENPESVTEIYKQLVSASYQDLRNFRSYAQSGNIYKGMEAFSFLEARQRQCYPDSLRSIREVLEFPQLFGDPSEVIYSYNRALSLKGNTEEQGILINRIAEIMLREGYVHAFRIWIKNHPVHDPAQTARHLELELRAEARFRPEETLEKLKMLSNSSADVYLSAELLDLVPDLAPDIGEMRGTLQFILYRFPHSMYRDAAGLRLMRLAFYLNGDMEEVVKISDGLSSMMGFGRDSAEIMRLRIAALARLGHYDQAVKDACLFSLSDSGSAEEILQFLVQTAWSEEREDVVKSLKNYMY